MIFLKPALSERVMSAVTISVSVEEPIDSGDLKMARNGVLFWCLVTYKSK